MTREERTRLIEQYAAGPDAVAESLAGFSADQLVAHPIPGKWSAAEIVHHLADSECISGIRIRRLVAESLPVISGYDQDGYAVRLRYNQRDIAPALQLFKSVRAATAAFLVTLGNDEWKRPGWHTESGAYDGEAWLRIYAVHAHGHAEQIRRLRAALEAKR